MLDLPVDFGTLTKCGAMMGSGGMIVMDDTRCMVEVARYYVNSLCEESCGKCTLCREGLRQMLMILTDICEGQGQEVDIELLARLGHALQDAALCALGKSAPNPVLSAIRCFREEYEVHIRGHRCPAGVCHALTRFAVDTEKCRGCSVCVRACPTGAITGVLKQPHRPGANVPLCALRTLRRVALRSGQSVPSLCEACRRERMTDTMAERSAYGSVDTKMRAQRSFA